MNPISPDWTRKREKGLGKRGGKRKQLRPCACRRGGGKGLFFLHIGEGEGKTQKGGGVGKKQKALNSSPASEIRKENESVIAPVSSLRSEGLKGGN